MCGRYEFMVDKEALEAYYHLSPQPDQAVAGLSQEVFPTQWGQILLPNKELALAKWGLQEPWTKQSIINSRLESVDMKKTTAHAFAHQRCIVAVSGFYEWGPDKTKYIIHPEGEALFSLAGVYKEYQQSNGQVYLAYSILTEASDPVMREVHDRMPVILPREFTDRYLNLSSSLPALKKSLAQFRTRWNIEQVA